MNREETRTLLKEYIKSESLLNHCEMVAQACEAYAISLEKTEQEQLDWWTAGLLHDIDWEAYPDEHPNKAVQEILPKAGYSKEIIEAIEAHAPERTGKEPGTELERYLFACDELSGFIHAVSLLRPTGYEGMKVKSVTKKLKTANFAANVSREDIKKGADLIETPLNDHIQFLINVFNAT
jgi:putative nucleotidyltransferase with HDIG domain